MTKRVLVVDDVAEMRALIWRILSADGYQVDVAATLAEARGLDPAGYSAVLVDAHLGTEQGTDLIEELRSADPAAVGRCLVITGGTADAGPAGSAVLTKPFRAADLLDAVRVLQQQAPPQQAPPQPAPPQPAPPQPAPPQPAPPQPDPPQPNLPQPNLPQPQPALPGPPPPEPGLPEPGARPEPGEGPGSSSGPSRDSPPPSPAQIGRLLAVTRRLRTRERYDLVGFLHDGPIQELTAGTLEAEMMRRSAPAGPASRVDAVLRQIEAAARALRWLVDGEWPFMQPEVQLAGALRQRCAWLLTEPLAIDIDPGCADMVPGDVPAVVDVAELMLLAAAPECCPVRAHLAVRGEPQLIELTLTVTASGDEPMGDLEAAREALRDLAGALGTVAHTENGAQQRRVRIALRHWGG